MIKRLRYYLDKVADNKTVTYRYHDTVDGQLIQKDFYDGECAVSYTGRPDKVGVRREPTFWYDGIAYTLQKTHKLSLDRPTIIIAIPIEKLALSAYTPATADFCLRAINQHFELINSEYYNPSRPDKENGKVNYFNPTSKILKRNAAYFDMCKAQDYKELGGNKILFNPDESPPDDILCLCIRIEVQLPFMKLDRAKTLLCKQLPKAVTNFVKSFDSEKLNLAIQLENKQNGIRTFLRENGYCAFVANGSILAREGGSDKPLLNSVPFKSPLEDEIEINGIKGLGIKCGVTVITGGGYSGKSTLLKALASGIYNHTTGDGRELCLTDDTAVTITAEDGRAVCHCNISPFIKWIPNADPSKFSTSHASGSVSQSANIVEAIDAGSRLLLIDEDRSATNFMIRDSIMKELIKREPIIPFTDRVNELAGIGVSTILVIGGSSEYLTVANGIYMMDEFSISNVTIESKELTNLSSSPTNHSPAVWQSNRVPTNGLTSYPQLSGKEKLSVLDFGFIIIGDECVDIRYIHDIISNAQISALAFILRYIANNAYPKVDKLEKLAMSMRGLRSVSQTTANNMDIFNIINSIYVTIENDGFGIVDSSLFGDVCRFMEKPRMIDLLLIINRLRYLKWEERQT